MKATAIAASVATSLALSTTWSQDAAADTLSEVRKAVTDGKTSISLRYRFEMVDQDGVDKNANASTLKTRLSWKSAAFKGFYTSVEVDNVSVIGSDNFNSTGNGKGQYPVVADPKGTDLNQAYLAYKGDGFTVTAGRQRINHNNQRFVGGVGWRQNEQTFDGYRLQSQVGDQLSFDYSYVYNVNRIFGPSGGKSDLKGKIHLFNSQYQINGDHQLAAYWYNMDFDTAAALSNRTTGVSYKGEFGPVKVYGAYARQSDNGDNPVDYDADYLALETSVKWSSVTFTGGYELLGSDNGKGFVTPLATLHKFQGFADSFLTTPGQGVKDLYLKGSTKLGPASFALIWHDLSSDKGNIDYGTEWDMVAKYPLAKKMGLVLKYAKFDSDGYSSDTDKLWAMVSMKF